MFCDVPKCKNMAVALVYGGGICYEHSWELPIKGSRVFENPPRLWIVL